MWATLGKMFITYLIIPLIEKFAHYLSEQSKLRKKMEDLKKNNDELRKKYEKNPSDSTYGDLP